MPLSFLSVRPPPPRLIACHVSPVAVLPWPSASAPQVPAALPSLSLSASSTPPPLTCALHCPHFESCSGCTHESNLLRPVIVDEATEFFKTVGVSDFTFDSCKIAHHPKRYEVIAMVFFESDYYGISKLWELYDFICYILRTAKHISLHAHIRSMVPISASIQLFSLIILSGFLFFETTKLGSCSADRNVGCKETERKALLELKAGLTDPSGRLSSWVGEDCCNWSGVGCNNVTGRVTMLNLRNEFSDGEDGTLLAFGGEINHSLLVLKDLIHLDLSMNNFEGVRIPNFIGSLEKLEYLNLSSASFGEVIPQSFGNLSRLLSLDLSYYLFEPIANDLRWLPTLYSLKYLNLGGVDLSKAKPRWLPTVNMLPSLVELHMSSCRLSVLPLTLPSMNFASLLILDLSNNDFNSTLPPWLFNLTKLVTLEMHSTNLHGALPETFGSLTSLRTLDLSDNSNIVGPLPRSLGMLCNLQTVNLPTNKFTGEITDFVDSLSTCRNSSLERLDLGYNYLTGNLPDSLGNLKTLRILKLWFNSFQGSIPKSIGKLKSLEEFYISNNQMSGSIPEGLGQLSSLTALDISENTWEGSITEAHFMKLGSLTDVSIYNNNPNISLVFDISSDWIPPFKLRYLNIRSCQLGPKFPTWLRNQTELVTLVLNNARISDTIPEWFWQLDFQLDKLDVAYNQLSGRVPNSLRFISPGTVDLSTNRFEGPLPLWSSNITMLYLRDNLFSGPIPRDISEVMPSLTDLDISQNSLNGSIPLSMGNLSQLSTMVISNNLLSGEIPNFWDSIPSLYILDVSNNSLSGSIPPSLTSLTILRFLILSSNHLSGKLPSMKNFTDMRSLDLGENNFSGAIPASIGESMPSLLILRLRLNWFSGSIPSQLCGLSNLHILDLSHNNISGNVPRCIGNLTGFRSILTNKDTEDYLYQGKLKVLAKGKFLEYNSILYLFNSVDLSDNNLSGEMPVGLTSLTRLGTLNLSMNHLTGNIPAKIEDLKQIETLDLSSNKLSGPIPQSMVFLTFLNHLNLSYNNLSGKIPTSNQFGTFIDLSIYEGNAGLCGHPLPTDCQGDKETPPVPSADGEDDDSKSDRLWFIFIVVIGFCFGFWGVFGTLAVKKSWRYAYFCFVDKVKYAVLDFFSAIATYLQKRS
ncbi:receptor-like protein EIX2 [Pyrus communis]|uniref:receptor-like protein EIX2 n=1 Tax=Pyrus communis TaxID=23211 RepID=UPI0035C12B36